MVQSAKVRACSCGVTGQHLASRRSSDRDHHDFLAAFCAATGAGSRLRATRKLVWCVQRLMTGPPQQDPHNCIRRLSDA